ncbi:MAG: gas vesicle protein [Actinocatenispora sp.]
MTSPDYGGLRPVSSSGGQDSLADILERVLDKGIVIAGDIMVNVLDIELLTLKVRLVVASVDTAKDMGIDWWTNDPFLTGGKQSTKEVSRLEDRVAELEQRLAAKQVTGDDGAAGEKPGSRGRDRAGDSA